MKGKGNIPTAIVVEHVLRTSTFCPLYYYTSKKV